MQSEEQSTEKSEEQTKAELFEENPDHFIHVGDCIVVVAVKRDEKGKISHYMMNSHITTEDEGHIAKGRAQLIIDSALMGLMRKKAEGGIIRPGSGNGGFMPGLRKFLKK